MGDTGDVAMALTDQCDDETYCIPGLYCTLCMHDLNREAYLIAQHPELPVPLCIECMDALREKEDSSVDVSDICTWCRDGGDLFMCDGPKCGRAICRDCIENNCESQLESIEAVDNWLCFCCTPSQLLPLHFTSALRTGQENSLYSKVKEITDTDEDCTDEGDSRYTHMKEEQLNSRLVLLQAIVDGIKEAGEVLQEDHLFQREKEFREELLENAKKTDPSKSVHLQTKEEIR
jgi:hypothetical protein